MGTVRDPVGALPNGALWVGLLDARNGRRRIETYRSPDGSDVRFIAAVPPGTWEVRPFGAPGLRFQPESRTVPAGAEHVDFDVTGPGPEKVLLRVADDTDGASLERFNVACRVGWRWMGVASSADESLPMAADRYVVWTSAHRPEIVTADAFVATRDGARVADVRLARGASEVLVFVDADDEAAVSDGVLSPLLATPLAGVRVLAEGRELATSDGDGLAVVPYLESGALTFELAGRRALASEIDDGLRCIWMIRE